MTTHYHRRPSRLAFYLTFGASMFGLAGAASAQSMDYGALQQVFGEPVTTSATGKPQRASEVPADMEIITQDEIRQSGATSVPQALEGVVGLDVRQSSANDIEIGVRGYNQPWNPRLLVLLNGRPVYENFYGDVVWSMIPVQMSEIRQIEVVKGPNSALFGFNAASGVINIITYNPLFDKQADATVVAGTEGVVETHLSTSMLIAPNVGLRLSFGRQISNEYDTKNLSPANAQILVRPEGQNGGADLRWQIAPKVEAHLEVTVAETQRGFPADAFAEHDRSNSERLGLSADTRLGALEVEGFRNQWKIDYLGPQGAEANNSDYNVKVSDLVKLNAENSLRLSGEYKYNSVTGPFITGDVLSYQIFSGAASWNSDLTKRLSINNSVRVDQFQLHMTGPLNPLFGQTLSDFNRRSLTGFTFNSGLVFKATDDDVLRALASRGLQLPSMEDIGQQQYFPPAGGSGAIGWIGNPNLRPTAVTNIEADWDHAFRSLNATLRMAVFGQANQSLFGWDAGIPYTVGPVTFTQSVNVGASQEIGAEVSLKGVSRQGVRWYGSYAFATIHDHIDGGIAPGVYTAFASSTPTNTVKFGLGKDFGGWELDAHGRLQSKFTDYLIGPLGYGPVVIKPYLTVDARAAYRLTTHLTAAVVVEQLNAAEQYQRSGVPVERRVLATLSAHY